MVGEGLYWRKGSWILSAEKTGDETPEEKGEGENANGTAYDGDDDDGGGGYATPAAIPGEDAHC